MRAFLTAIAVFGGALALWGAVDVANAIGGTAYYVPESLPAMAVETAGLFKLTGGAIILVLCVGLDAILTIGHEIIRRHPGIGPKPTLWSRVADRLRGDPLPGDDEV